MLKTFGTRVKGFVYPVTSRFAGILIESGMAAEFIPKAEREAVKEDKEAAQRETKEEKTKKTKR